jgi:hypothetical protein
LCACATFQAVLGAKRISFPLMGWLAPHRARARPFRQSQEMGGATEAQECAVPGGKRNNTCAWEAVPSNSILTSGVRRQACERMESRSLLIGGGDGQGRASAEGVHKLSAAWRARVVRGRNMLLDVPANGTGWRAGTRGDWRARDRDAKACGREAACGRSKTGAGRVESKPRNEGPQTVPKLK